MKSTMRGWEFRKGIEDAAHKICSTLGLPPITLRWANIPTACIDGKGRMIVCDIKDDAVVNKQLFMKYMGFIVHELLHRKYTTNGLEFSNQFVRMLWNGLEDARIENTAIADSLTGNIGELLTVLADSMVVEGMAHVTDWANPAQFPFVIAIFCRQHVKRKAPVHPLILPIFEQARERLNDCTDSKQVRTLAQWVFDEINTAIEEQPPEGEGDTPDEDQPTDDDGDESSDGTSPIDGDGDGTAKGKSKPDGDADADGDSTDFGDSPVNKIDPNDAVCPEPTLDRPNGVAGGVSWSPDQTMAGAKAHFDPTAAKWDIKPVGGAKLRYEVRRLFEMSGIDEYQFNRRHGQLDAGNLHTIASGNDRVFKRHHEEGGIDSAVVFIMDCSGSMFSERMRYAAPVMATMLDTLDRAGVATCIVTFGTQVSLLKPFEMNKVKAMPLIEQLCNGSDNSDSQALRYAHSLLLSRPEQRKVAFVLGDGGVDRDEEKRCKQQAVSGQKLGITTIGVGIIADLSRMYPNNIIINDLNQLAGASFKQIKLAA